MLPAEDVGVGSKLEEGLKAFDVLQGDQVNLIAEKVMVVGLGAALQEQPGTLLVVVLQRHVQRFWAMTSG